MILEWFVAFVTGIVGSFADWLPEWTVPTIPEGALSAALTLNSVVPAAELVGVALMILTLYVLLFVYRVLKIVVSHVPLFGGSG